MPPIPIHCRRSFTQSSRFLEAISFSHGSQLNITNVARECAVERRTVANFVEILYDLLIAFPLPAFRRRAKRQVVQHPKFYFVDPGVFRALRPSGPLDRPEEIGAAALEGLVLQMIRAHISYRNAGEELYSWRTRHGLEVDCVIYGSGKILAVEVKNSARVRDEDERGLPSCIAAAALSSGPASTGCRPSSSWPIWGRSLRCEHPVLMS